MTANEIPAGAGDRVLPYSEAVALHKAGRVKEAHLAYQRLVQQDTKNGDAWFGLGTASAQLSQSVEAIICFERAMGLLGVRPQIHHNMAAAKSALGRLTEAEAHYKEAIRLKPDYYEAYFNFANVKSLKNGSKVVASIERHLKTPNLTDVDKMFLHFAAGKIYDDMREHDHAFPHMKAGNQVRNNSWDAAKARTLFDDIEAAFTPELLERFKGKGSQDQRVVFVVGMPRSGTTLTEQVIASHSQARGVGELSALNNVTQQIGKTVHPDLVYPSFVHGLTSEVLQQVGHSLSEFLAKRAGDTSGQILRVVDKTPLNFRHLGLAVMMLPNVRIVHCRRDPLDTCLSCFFQNFRVGQEYAFDLDDLGTFYGLYMRMMQHWRDVGIPMYEIDYADFVADPETQFRSLLDFVELDWEPGVLNFYKNKGDVQSASRAQVRRKPYQTSIGRAAPYRAYLEPLAEALRREGVEVA